MRRELRLPMLYHVGDAAADHAGDHQRHQKVPKRLKWTPGSAAQMHKHLPRREESERHAAPVCLHVQKSDGKQVGMHGSSAYEGQHGVAPLFHQGMRLGLEVEAHERLRI